jgi:DNA-binding transcriptional ArsR family regulator
MQVIPRADLALQARFYRGLADPARLALLTALRDGEHTVGEAAAAAGVGLSTASRHLACLRDCGLLEARPDWRHVRYSLAEGVDALLAANEAFVERVADRVAACQRPEMGDE